MESHRRSKSESIWDKEQSLSSSTLISSSDLLNSGTILDLLGASALDLPSGASDLPSSTECDYRPKKKQKCTQSLDSNLIQQINELQTQVQILKNQNAQLELVSITGFHVLSLPSANPNYQSQIAAPTPIRPYDYQVDYITLWNENRDLKERLLRLEYVSLVWEKYCSNLQFMNSQNQVLREELELLKKEIKRQKS